MSRYKANHVNLGGFSKRVPLLSCTQFAATRVFRLKNERFYKTLIFYYLSNRTARWPRGMPDYGVPAISRMGSVSTDFEFSQCV